MRALAKDPDQRYSSAEEMDADLARVARGLSVSRKTEEAMTQVLAGAGAATAATMIAQPASATPPPAPPAYRAPSGYYGGYSGPVRRRAVWPLDPGLLALSIAGGTAATGPTTRCRTSSRRTRPIAVVDVGLRRSNPQPKLEQQGFRSRSCRSRARRWRPGGDPPGPGRRRQDGAGEPGDDQGLDGRPKVRSPT